MSGIVVIPLAVHIFDDGETAMMEVKGVVWKDCARNRGGHKLSCPPRALTKITVTTFDGGFEVREQDLFKKRRTFRMNSRSADL